mgnify:CR=1 FL=1
MEAIRVMDVMTGRTWEFDESDAAWGEARQAVAVTGNPHVVGYPDLPSVVLIARDGDRFVNVHTHGDNRWWVTIGATSESNHGIELDIHVGYVEWADGWHWWSFYAHGTCGSLYDAVCGLIGHRIKTIGL